ILFMTDGVDRTHAPRFARHRETSGDQLLFLAFGSAAGGLISETGAGGQTFGLVDGRAPAVDLGGISVVAEAGGGTVVRATPDLADVDALTRRIRSHLVDTIQQDDRLQWRDSGYALIWPLAFLVLLWARRGWTVHWV
ncbi:MAG: hypothetical protein ACR2PO_01230, partial [Methyloligellaceae bacterium]